MIECFSFYFAFMNLNWTIAFPRPYFPFELSYKDQFFLIGSCFTEHIGKFLQQLKFKVTQNPAGILFDPHSIAFHLFNWARGIYPTSEELFLDNELWHHWKYHTQFSSTNFHESYQKIYDASHQAILFLKQSTWLVVTLGSSYTYKLDEGIPVEHYQKFGVGYAVANCHKCPNTWFQKYLNPIHETYQLLNEAFNEVLKVNPKIRFLVNISPVRHLRDGVVENNRSKARLLEAVHQLVENRKDTFYLPSYELVIDVLRDYRFYDLDKAHPNYEATQWVLNYFVEHYFSKECQEQIKKIQDIITAYHHQPRNPDTVAHQQFLASYLEKTLQMQKVLPDLDWGNELRYFGRE